MLLSVVGKLCGFVVGMAFLVSGEWGVVGRPGSLQIYNERERERERERGVCVN